jgi:CyaY protein
LSSLSEEQYESLAFPELLALVHALDALDAPDVEAELASDILSVEFSDGTKYVVNSHRAARQIWMAAERNAWHFDWVPEKRQWIAEKSGDELWSTISRVIGKRLGATVTLVRRDSA